MTHAIHATASIGTQPGPLARRYVRFVAPRRPLVCPHGHLIREDAIVLEHAGVRCKHRFDGGQGQCDALLYVLLFVGSGYRIVAEVSIEELRQMQQRGMDVGTVLTFLGLDGPLLLEIARP